MSNNSLDEIVGIEPLLIGKLLYKDQGICIPAYQRHFSWDRSNFVRFLDDIANDMLEKEPFTFLGSIICYECTGECRSKLKGRPPNSVYMVVDGQQRISLLASLAILLRSKIDKKWSAVKSSKEGWFEPEVKHTQTILKDIIAISGRGEPDYPRIIRSDKDEWYPEPKEGYYKSPVAKFICGYLNHISSHGDSSQFDYKDVGTTITFKSLIRILDGLLEDFCQDKKGKYALINLANRENMHKIWIQNQRIPTIKNLTGGEKQLFKLLLLANYLCKRLYVARIEMRGASERSFAIFERLNMTGATLNAFEAFKPYVVRELGREYKEAGCPQREDIESIEEGYVGIENRKKSDKHVAELIVSMALAYSGEKIGLSTHIQHEHLSKNYALPIKQPEADQYKDSEEKKDEYKDFLHCFRIVSDMKMMFKATKNGITDFLYKGTDFKIPDDPKIDKDLDEASFCLQFLNAANFKLTVSLLSIYLHQARLKGDNESISDFCDVVRKTAAFCAIWRSFFETTHNIDAMIRGVIQSPPNHQSLKLRDFYYGNKSKQACEVLGTKELGLYFIDVLQKHQITDLEKWRNRVTKRQIYKIKQVARFIILVGSHKMGLKAGSGKLTRLNGAPPFIIRDGFRHRCVKSVEHIIPMNEREHENSQYDDEAKNRLWNLTLVPSEVNGILSNRTWAHKRKFYQYYSAENEQEQEECLENLYPEERKSKKFKRFKLGDDTFYLPIIKYLAELDTEDFTEEQGADRTQEIVDNCWKTLTYWLGWKAKDVK